MIANDKQYETTKYWLKRFAKLRETAGEGANAQHHPKLIQARKDAATSFILELDGEMRVYETQYLNLCHRCRYQPKKADEPTLEFKSLCENCIYDRVRAKQGHGQLQQK